MSEPKPKPGRPRKWSSDAERMRVTREAKRQEKEAEVAKLQRNKVAAAARIGVSPPTDPAHPEDPPPGIGDKIELDLARKQIEALRRVIRSREDEYDTLYGWYRERETELIRALGRLYVADPDGPYWDGIRNDDGTLQEVCSLDGRTRGRPRGRGSLRGNRMQSAETHRRLKQG